MSGSDPTDNCHPPPPPYRVAILVQDLEFGGTQRYAIQLLQHLNRQRFAAELWVLRGGFDMAPSARASASRVIWFSKRPRIEPSAVYRLGRQLISQPPHLLYTLTVVPNIWGRLLGRLARIPVVISGYRGLDPRQFESLLWPLSDRIICNAAALREKMILHHRVPSRKIVVVPNGVDGRFYRPVTKAVAADPIVLCIGRLVPQKDPVGLLEAFRLLTRKVAGARLILLGNGPMRQTLKRKIRSMSLADCVRLNAGVEDIRPYLAAARVVCLNSVSEASPNVLFEAMAAGRPVVATRVGGIPEVVQHGQTGLLVPPKDPVALANALARLLGDPQRAASMGAKAREIAVEQYSPAKAAMKTERVFLEALDAYRRARLNPPPWSP